ncbi:DUF3470 domain-containing protein [Ralstonia pseudosolanacearum]|nr:DUF3470 domain-containing protein [Ralstonia pseudosolanacearum]
MADYLLPADKAEWLGINRERAAQTPVITSKLPPLPGAPERKDLQA